MPRVADELDWQIYFKKDNDENATPFYWLDDNSKIIKDRPLTFRSAYPQLKAIFESDKVSIKTKAETIKNKADEAEISLLKIERDKLEAKQKALLEENERLKGEIEELKKQIEISTTKAKAKTKAKSEFKQGHRKKMFTQEQIEEMVKLKEQGLSNVKIGKIYHCDESTIRRYLKTFIN